MTRYSLAPGYITLNYTVTIATIAMQHHMRFQIQPEAPVWVALNLVPANGGAGVLWSTAVDALMLVLKPLFSTGTTFVDATLHRQDTASSAPILIATSALGVVGTNGGAAATSLEAKYIFRSSNGNLYYSTLIEPAGTPDQALQYAGLTAGQKAWVDYVRGTTSIIRARDQGLTTTFLRLVTKANDRVRKKRMQL